MAHNTFYAQTSKVYPLDIKTELVMFLRNQNIFTISQRGVTTTTDNTTGVTSQTDFVLANTNVKNIRTVTVNSVAQTYGTDYIVNLDTATIRFTTAPTNGIAIAINYDYGSNDKIFPDFPQGFLKLNQFPRLGFDITSSTTQEHAIGAGSNISTYNISVIAYDKTEKAVEEYLALLRQKIIDAKKSFYYFTFITPIGSGILIPSQFGENTLMQKNQDFKILFVLETVGS